MNVFRRWWNGLDEIERDMVRDPSLQVYFGGGVFVVIVLLIWRFVVHIGRLL